MYAEHAVELAIRGPSEDGALELAEQFATALCGGAMPASKPLGIIAWARRHPDPQDSDHWLPEYDQYERYASLDAGQRLAALIYIGLRPDVPPEQAALFAYENGAVRDLATMCRVLDARVRHRDYLLDVVDAHEARLLAGVCPDASTDPRPLLPRVANVGMALEKRWRCGLSYELILDRNPDEARKVWRRFLSLTGHPSDSRAWLAALGDGDCPTNGVFQARPIDLLRALRDAGFFGDLAQARSSFWVRDLIARGTGASAWLLFAALSEGDPSRAAHGSLFPPSFGIDHRVSRAAARTGDARLTEMAAALAQYRRGRVEAGADGFVHLPEFRCEGP